MLVAEAIAAGRALDAVYVVEGSTEELDGLGLAPSTPLNLITADALEWIGASVTPQPLVAVAQWPSWSLADLLAAPVGPVVVAVDLSDPGNAGTLVRSAEAAGARGVVLTKGSVDPRSPKVVRAGAGSVARLPVVDGLDAVAVLRELRATGLRTIAADASVTSSLWDAALPADVVVVVGSESHGLPPSVAAEVDEVIRIPMASSVESLNVGVSAAIVLFEAARRRGLGVSDLNPPPTASNLTGS